MCIYPRGAMTEIMLMIMITHNDIKNNNDTNDSNPHP